MQLSCPNCGYDEYYRKMSINGKSQYHYRYDKEEADNSHIHDTLDYRESKTTYCCKCHKKVKVS